jgi:Uma2 family endonuclease/antitoxin (DNA-binding transcriptional repressor) of toxin-antitoxin stability system
MKVTSTDIKNSFGRYLRLCSTEPVYITKNGEVIAKLLNHTIEDEIIENSGNLRKLYDVDTEMNKLYEPLRVAEAMEAYNANRIRMTYDEFKRMNENSNNRYEYIDGEVYMLASPGVYHQRIISRLHIEMDRYLKGKPCDVFTSPFDVILLRRGNSNFTNIVQPDLLVICNWDKDINESGRYTGIPRLVVEVLSPGNTSKEMFVKLDLYRDSGIEEYWIIDSVRGYASIYKFHNYTISETRIYNAHDLCESMIYPGLTFSVNE